MRWTQLWLTGRSGGGGGTNCLLNRFKSIVHVISCRKNIGFGPPILRYSIRISATLVSFYPSLVCSNFQNSGARGACPPPHPNTGLAPVIWTLGKQYDRSVRGLEGVVRQPADTQDTSHCQRGKRPWNNKWGWSEDNAVCSWAPDTPCLKCQTNHNRTLLQWRISDCIIILFIK